MLSKDRLYFVKALDALDRLTAHDQRAQKVNQQVRQGWIAATDRSTRTRVYRINVNAQRYTDVELAFAWLYQDVAHGDESTTGDLGIVERYRAAVGVFSHVAVMSLRTLDYLKHSMSTG